MTKTFWSRGTARWESDPKEFLGKPVGSKQANALATRKVEMR